MVEWVDTVHLKCIASNSVPVQVRPSVPFYIIMKKSFNSKQSSQLTKADKIIIAIFSVQIIAGLLFFLLIK